MSIKSFSRSNMASILAKLRAEFNNVKSRNVSAILLASNWVNGKQTISVSGLGANQNGIVSVSHDATDEQREAARDAMLSVIGQADGSLTIAADGEIPVPDIPVSIVMLN